MTPSMSSWSLSHSPTELPANEGPPWYSPKSSLFGVLIEHSVLAMITSAANAPWPLDVPITDGASAGLRAASVIRMKLFTLDNQLILRKAGVLSSKDRQTVLTTLRKLLAL
jgi:mRNA interferase MazF